MTEEEVVILRDFLYEVSCRAFEDTASYGGNEGYCDENIMLLSSVLGDNNESSRPSLDFRVENDDIIYITLELQDGAGTGHSVGTYMYCFSFLDSRVAVSLFLWNAESWFLCYNANSVMIPQDVAEIFWSNGVNILQCITMSSEAELYGQGIGGLDPNGNEINGETYSVSDFSENFVDR